MPPLDGRLHIAMMSAWKLSPRSSLSTRSPTRPHTDQTRTAVRQTIQSFLDAIIVELGKGNRLEFRDFGVFEVHRRKARSAQNPRTLKRVRVPARRTVKFKPGRLMLQAASSKR